MAAPFFAALQCAHEILQHPTRFSWELDSEPKNEWIREAQRALNDESTPVEAPEFSDPEQSDDDAQNEWDAEVSEMESDATPEQNAQSEAPDLSDQPDVVTTEGVMPMAKLREVLQIPDGNGNDTAALEQIAQQTAEQLQSEVQRIERDAEQRLNDMREPVRIAITDERDPKPVTVESDGVYHSALPEVIEWLQAGINVMLVGPAGSGKTTLAAQCAEILKREFSFTGALMQKYELLGFTDANGTYHDTPFRRAFENGHVYLWDEIDASNAQAAVAFNAALENPWADFPDGIVQRHADFVSIAAANTFGHGANRQYVGRNALDGATLDRFAVMELDYDSGLEHALAGNDEWVRKVQAWRRACNELGLKHIISQRASLKGAQMLRRGNLSEDAIAKALVFKGLDADAEQKIRNTAGV
jgi:MoxR-like ATPase